MSLRSHAVTWAPHRSWCSLWAGLVLKARRGGEGPASAHAVFLGVLQGVAHWYIKCGPEPHKSFWDSLRNGGHPWWVPLFRECAPGGFWWDGNQPPGRLSFLGPSLPCPSSIKELSECPESWCDISPRNRSLLPAGVLARSPCLLLGPGSESQDHCDSLPGWLGVSPS